MYISDPSFAAGSAGSACAQAARLLGRGGEDSAPDLLTRCAAVLVVCACEERALPAGGTAAASWPLLARAVAGLYRQIQKDGRPDHTAFLAGVLEALRTIGALLEVATADDLAVLVTVAKAATLTGDATTEHRIRAAVGRAYAVMLHRLSLRPHTGWSWRTVDGPSISGLLTAILAE